MFRIENICFKEEAFSKHLIIELLLSYPEFFLVAEHKGKILGYISATLENDHCHIYSIAVLPEFRNKGIATNLMKELLNKAKEKGIKKVVLEVKTNNLEAIKLYKKFNFEIKGIKSKYYPDGTDAYVMELKL
ncbi:MAG: ribosomal protein S18-alanine N-acetyltransferase [Thermoproteota archaeon]|nr:ribosomal protein S18-alanine N-acetyltransferase [Thermoproteota archaeon]